MKATPSRLAIVIPCYEEQEVLGETTSRLTVALDHLVAEALVAPNSYILYVNDGSHDCTWSLISKYHSENQYVCGVNLAANVGHQNALVAGLSVAVEDCDMIVSIDADLQDDINAIKKMVIKYKEGKDIVYGVRASRQTDSWFKRTTALGFYTLMRNMGVKSVYNHADYRLMSKRALRQLLQYGERNLFLRGIVPLIGYETDCVYYDRAERFAGESKYPLAKMISFAFDGITSFSSRPVHSVLFGGFAFLLVAIAILLWVSWAYCCGKVVPGWSSLMFSFWFCAGCILIGLGIVGEYVGKIYIEVKNRPRFNIEKILRHE